MAVCGIGTDIVQMDRFSQRLAANPALAARILTAAELTLFAEHKQPARYLAKRFAAKEAVGKALGTGIGRGVSFQHIEIDNNHYGQPGVTLLAGAKQRAEDLGANEVLLSLSDERDYCVATALLQSK